MKNMGKRAESKELTRKQRDTRSKLTKAVICFVVALVFFIVLLVIMSSVLNQSDKGKYYKATSNLVAGTKITQSTLDKFFKLEYEERAGVPEGAFEEGQLTAVLGDGKFLNRDIYMNEIITDKLFSTVQSSVLDGMVDPVKMSISAKAVSNAVSGEIREGDLIDIFCATEMATSGYTSTTEIELIAQNVYVEGAYNSSGEYMSRTDTVETEEGSENEENKGVSLMFNIIIPRAEQSRFVQKAVTSEFYFTKILDTELNRETIFGYSEAVAIETAKRREEELNNINDEIEREEMSTEEPSEDDSSEADMPLGADSHTNYVKNSNGESVLASFYGGSATDVDMLVSVENEYDIDVVGIKDKDGKDMLEFNASKKDGTGEKLYVYMYPVKDNGEILNVAPSGVTLSDENRDELKELLNNMDIQAYKEKLFGFITESTKVQFGTAKYNSSTPTVENEQQVQQETQEPSTDISSEVESETGGSTTEETDISEIAE